MFIAAPVSRVTVALGVKARACSSSLCAPIVVNGDIGFVRVAAAVSILQLLFNLSFYLKEYIFTDFRIDQKQREQAKQHQVEKKQREGAQPTITV